MKTKLQVLLFPGILILAIIVSCSDTGTTDPLKLYAEINKDPEPNTLSKKEQKK